MGKLKILLITISFLAFLGFLDSTYLTILHYQNVFPPCSITHGCETVQTSQYATIGNIPVALLGSVYYLVLTVFSIIILQTTDKKLSAQLMKYLFFLALAGFIASLIFFSLQAFVIRAFCQYCLLAELLSTLILTFSIVLLRLKEK